MLLTYFPVLTYTDCSQLLVDYRCDVLRLSFRDFPYTNSCQRYGCLSSWLIPGFTYNSRTRPPSVHKHSLEVLLSVCMFEFCNGSYCGAPVPRGKSSINGFLILSLQG
jgi:hypothetical protein